jgi:drug/metabolite transporter (DMT)-like permease
VISAAGAWAALDQAVTATQGVGMAIVIGVLVLVVRRDARSAAATGAS